MKLLSLLLVSLAVTGCSTYSSNTRVGNGMSYASLGDQRKASQEIKVLKEVPAGAEVLAEIDAGRCHRRFTEGEPTEQTVLLDLKLSAYSLGADAIADVQIKKESGLSGNCWYVLDGRAKAISLSSQ